MRATGIALCGFLTLASLAHAQDRDTEARVHALLSLGVEQTVSPSSLDRLGPEVSAALIAIYTRVDEPRHVRLRALSALGRRPDPRATTFLLALLHAAGEVRPNTQDALHPARSSLVLRRAIEGLAMRKVPDAEADLTLSLAHRDLAVREAAVHALLQYQTKSAEQSLTLHVTRERSERLKRLITDRSAPHRDLRSNGPKSAPRPR